MGGSQLDCVTSLRLDDWYTTPKQSLSPADSLTLGFLKVINGPLVKDAIEEIASKISILPFMTCLDVSLKPVTRPDKTIYIIPGAEADADTGCLNCVGQQRAAHLLDVFDGQVYHTPQSIFVQRLESRNAQCQLYVQTAANLARSLNVTITVVEHTSLSLEIDEESVATPTRSLGSDGEGKTPMDTASTLLGKVLTALSGVYKWSQDRQQRRDCLRGDSKGAVEDILRDVEVKHGPVLVVWSGEDIDCLLYWFDVAAKPRGNPSSDAVYTLEVSVSQFTVHVKRDVEAEVARSNYCGQQELYPKKCLPPPSNPKKNGSWHYLLVGAVVIAFCICCVRCCCGKRGGFQRVADREPGRE